MTETEQDLRGKHLQTLAEQVIEDPSAYPPEVIQILVDTSLLEIGTVTATFMVPVQVVFTEAALSTEDPVGSMRSLLDQVRVRPALTHWAVGQMRQSLADMNMRISETTNDDDIFSPAIWEPVSIMMDDREVFSSDEGSLPLPSSDEPPELESSLATAGETTSGVSTTLAAVERKSKFRIKGKQAVHVLGQRDTHAGAPDMWRSLCGLGIASVDDIDVIEEKMPLSGICKKCAGIIGPGGS